MKRLLTLLLAALCLSALAAPAVSAATPTAPSGIRLNPAIEKNCQDIDGNINVVGEKLTHFGNAIDGVGAYLTLFGNVNVCTDTTGLDITSATALWIAIQPNNQQPGENKIVQVGMMKCANEMSEGWGHDPCEHKNEWRFFYAFGGCNGNNPWPRDLGPVSGPYNNSRQFKILHNATSVYFYISGVEVAQISYSQMSCWGAHQDNRAFAGCETWDRGDSCGGSTGGSGYGGDLTLFDQLGQRRASDDVWYTQQLVTDPCYSMPVSRYRCDPVYYTGNDNELWLWSVQ